MTEMKEYVDSLIQQIQAYREEENGRFGSYSVDTVFIGGGTPSLLPAEELERVMTVLRQVFSIRADGEITIEANPKTVTREKLMRYRSMGINRLSIGCQSTDEGILAFMGRAHGADDFFETFRLARACGFSNINVDLMFGMKGQSVASWRATMEQVLALKPEHLSFYSLQVEEGTPFFEMQRWGEGCQCTDEENRQMYGVALELLDREGFVHYEISNGAKPGFCCKHNLKYWNMEDYLGLGLGAHSYIQGVRFANTSQLDAYLHGALEPTDVYVNRREDELSDYLFTGLRKREGIENKGFQKKFGESLEEVYGVKMERLIQEGFLAFDGVGLCLTRKGLDFSNTVLRELI